MLPGRWQTALLIAALLSPGAASMWKETALLRGPTDARHALRRLGVTCLSYALVTALVWATNLSAASMVDSLSTVLLQFLLIPIALLLVAASSAGRSRTERSPGRETITRSGAGAPRP